MRQGLALVSEEKHDIAGLRLRLSQCQPEAHAVDGVAVLAALQGVTRPAPAELFLRSTLDRRDLEMVTPSRLSISPMRARKRPIVSVGNGRLEQRCRHTQRRFRLDGGRSRGRAGLERLDAAANKVAAPQPHRILANPERFRDPRAGPTRQSQQHGSRPIRLAAIARNRQGSQCRLLLFTRRHQEIYQPCPTPAKSV